MYFVFFSKEQRKRLNERRRGATFAKLEDGRIVEYTEVCREERPSGNWGDYILLGKGDFDHIVGASEDAPEIIRSEGLRNTTSTKKFILLKTHTSLPCDEKVKIKSPKNILKKRPYGYF